MTNEKTWLTCKEVGVLLGYTQRHIVNLIKKGKVSAEKDEDGKYYIHKSEFFRAYPLAAKVEIDGTVEKTAGNNTMKMLEEKIRHLQEMVDEKKKQNDFLMGQIGINDEKQSKMLDALNNHARLLEFKETREKAIYDSLDKKRLSWWPFKRR